jgi:hypothetical protein
MLTKKLDFLLFLKVKDNELYIIYFAKLLNYIKNYVNDKMFLKPVIHSLFSIYLFLFVNKELIYSKYIKNHKIVFFNL